jgi:hypothetical protein
MAKPDGAPPPERTHSPKSDSAVMQMTSMSEGARCDLFFVPVVRILGFVFLGFVRPSNVANEPRGIMVRAASAPFACWAAI